MSEDLMGIIMLAGFVLFLVSLGLQLWCVRDLQKIKFRYEGRRALWLNMIWFSSFIGCVLYLINRKRLKSELDAPTHRF
jgi:hypothetical protein